MYLSIYILQKVTKKYKNYDDQVMTNISDHLLHNTRKKNREG